MSDEQNAVPSAWTRITQRVFWEIMQQRVSLSLLALAMTEALLSPLFGWHLALASIAIAIVAIGLVLVHGALGIQCVGSWLQTIHQQITNLREEEEKKKQVPQQSAAPEKPFPIWKN